MLERIIWEKIIDHMAKDGPGCVDNFPDIRLVLMLHIGKARGSGGIWRLRTSRRGVATSPCDSGINDCLKGNAVHVESCQCLARNISLSYGVRTEILDFNRKQNLWVFVHYSPSVNLNWEHVLGDLLLAL